MLLVGTSAVVQPAASLPYLAKQKGAVVVEVNPERAFTEADYFLAEKAGRVLPKIVAHIQQLN
jgi:NAD-dependent deacetylase